MKVVEWEDDTYEVPVPPDVNEYHILVVDEDQIFSRNVASILHKASYQVTEIQIPELALSKIQEQPKLFDLVLLGTPLKALDCISFLEDILAVNEYMAVIFMSSKPDFYLTVTALQSGATLVLDKPIKKHNFLSLWQHVLRKRSLAEKKKERENALMGINLRSASLNDSESSSVHDAKGKKKEVKVEEVDQSPMAGKKDKPTKLEAAAKECKAKIAMRKRKERGEARGDQRKSRAVWNDKLHKKFMDVLTKDNTDNAGNGARATSQATINPNLRRHLVASLVQRNRLKAIYLEAATSENSVVRGTPKGSGLQFKTASTKSPEAGATGASKTSNGAGLAAMDLQARIRQIRSAYETRKQQSDQEVNSIYRAPNSAVTVTKPCALMGSESGAAFLGMQLSGNMTRSPRVNASRLTPALNVSLTAGETLHPNETQGLTHTVNSENRNLFSEDEDEVSSSSDEATDDGFGLDELLPELKNGDDADENASTSEDHEE